MEDLTDIGSCCEQRVIAEVTGVAISSTGFGLAEHVADRRVEVDNKIISRACALDPSPAKRLFDNTFELTNMTVSEASQEGSERRWCHDPKRQHCLGGTCSQHVCVIDVASTAEHCDDQVLSDTPNAHAGDTEIAHGLTPLLTRHDQAVAA